jgi:hypothetical protein
VLKVKKIGCIIMLPNSSEKEVKLWNG